MADRPPAPLNGWLMLAVFLFIAVGCAVVMAALNCDLLRDRL